VSSLGRILHRLVVILVISVFLLPMLWVVLSAFKTSAGLVTYPPRFWPDPWSLENFIEGLRFGDFPRYFMNSTFVTVTSTLITVTISTMAGFAFAKYRFPGRNIIFLGILSMLMISLEVVMIPMFLTLKSLGLINTLWGIIIPPAATPTGVFLMRQYMLGIPDELVHAARIDGASEWQIFAYIMVPLSVPAIATLVIFSFVWRWNDFLWPFVVITDDELATVQLALANFVGEYAVHWGPLLAMTTLSMLPPLIVFILFQRYFLRGIATTGLKG
jgi:alpha-1,4-digalacturonate transport system permease protein